VLSRQAFERAFDPEWEPEGDEAAEKGGEKEEAKEVKKAKGAKKAKDKNKRSGDTGDKKEEKAKDKDKDRKNGDAGDKKAAAKAKEGKAGADKKEKEKEKERGGAKAKAGGDEDIAEAGAKPTKTPKQAAKDAERERKRKEAGAVRLQAWARTRAAQAELRVRRSRAKKVRLALCVSKLQAMGRGRFAKATHRRKLAGNLLLQRVLRGGRSRRAAGARRAGLLRIQKAFRGKLMLALVRRLSRGAICVEVFGARDLPDTFMTCKPRVRVALEPKGAATPRRERLTSCSSIQRNEGSSHIWNKNTVNQVFFSLDTKKGEKKKSEPTPTAIMLEVCDDGVMGLEVIATACLPMPFVSLDMAPVQWVPLKPSGVLEVRTGLLTDR
jgi:hypothetical protein